jgi:uncharacterized protein YllA (UPF0747 family)
MDRLSYAELPGIPKIWLDYAAGLLSGLASPPAFPDSRSLQGQVEKARSGKYRRENLSRLLAEGSASGAVIMHGIEPSSAVAVVTEVQASLFGGPLFHLLKCLTAAKICRELARRGIPAVPMCWVGGAYEKDLSSQSIRLLDDEGELHWLRLGHDSTDFSASDPLPGKQIAELLMRIEGLGKGDFDAETVEILRSAYCSGETLASATARLLSALMKEWGVIALDPNAPRFKPVLEEARAVLRDQAGGFKQSAEGCATAFLEQCSVFPVAAIVIGPCELNPFLDSLPLLDQLDLPRAMPWPQPGATILDRKTSRTLEKYHLGFRELFSGEKEVLGKIRRATPRSVSVQLTSLAREIGRSMEEMGSLIPAGDKILKTRNDCRERMVYQIEKLRERFEAACAGREETAERRVHRACNLLAPDGRTQESGLSGIQFLLRHSRSVLQLLYERLDVLKFEHQLISMD